jgi:hypothetical protein
MMMIAAQIHSLMKKNIERRRARKPTLLSLLLIPENLLSLGFRVWFSYLLIPLR